MLGSAVVGVVAPIGDFPGVVVAAAIFGMSVVCTVEEDSSVGSSQGSDAPPDSDPCSLARGVTASASASSSFLHVLDCRVLPEDEGS